jgi:multidrug efflux pump
LIDSIKGGHCPKNCNGGALFKNTVKPLIVFAAIPYGMSGAFGMLYITASPFGFMAFLGIVSLIGVIVSHIIVLFDFIEERRDEGDDLATPRSAA